jgi:DNA-binding IclR family transcriptional regulator
VLHAVREAGDRGVTSHAVAKSTELRSSNTPGILKALRERGLVRADGENPTIWVAVS